MNTSKESFRHPAILNEAECNYSFQPLESLRGLNTESTGYTIAVGEEVSFPTLEQIQEHPRRYLKIGVTQKGSTNKRALVLVQRKSQGSDEGYLGWFNLSVLSRCMFDKDGHKNPVDVERAKMLVLPDDYSRAMAVLGKKVIGCGITCGYGIAFETRKYVDLSGKETSYRFPLKNEDGSLVFQKCEFVTISIQESCEVDFDALSKKVSGSHFSSSHNAVKLHKAGEPIKGLDFEEHRADVPNRFRLGNMDWAQRYLQKENDPIKFTDREKLAMINILGIVAFSDMHLDRNEVYLINALQENWSIDARLGQDIPETESFSTVRNMDVEKRKVLHALIELMIKADRVVVPIEELVKSMVVSKCNLPMITHSEMEAILKNILGTQTYLYLNKN